MVVSRNTTSLSLRSLFRSGKCLTEFIMIVAIVGTVIGCGWMCQDWLFGSPSLDPLAQGNNSNASAVYAVAISPDQEYCVSVGLEGVLRTHKLDSHLCLDEVNTMYRESHCLAFAPDGKHLVLGSSTGHLEIWDFGANSTPPRHLDGHTEEIVCCAFHPSGDFFVTSAWDRKCTCWNTDTLERIWTVQCPTGPSGSIDFSEDGERVVLGDIKGFVRVRDAYSGDLESEFHVTIPDRFFPRNLPNNRIIGVKFLPESPYILVATFAGTMEVWDLESQSRLREFDTTECGIRSLDLSRDGQLAITGGRDGRISIWNVKNGTCHKSWPGHVASVLGIACSADNSRIVSVGWDGQTKIWDL